MTYTAKQYANFQDVYDHLNVELWDGTLPPCLITLQRKARARGFFRSDGFHARTDSSTTDEIALNPDAFHGRTDREIMSTLAHEMAHLWQHHMGNPSRTGYHNVEWAAEMERIGLKPSDTGLPGGKRTGQKMTHFIVESGAFDTAINLFLTGRKAVEWMGATSGAVKGKATKAAASKTKFSCPACHQNAWAKPGASLACANIGNHDDGEPVIMVPMEGNDRDGDG